MKRLISGLMLSLGALALMLVAAEVLTRLFSDVYPPLTQRDPEIGRRYVKNLATEVFVQESGRRIALRFNQDGFRGPPRDRLKPEATCRIAIIGDSQIAAIATPEEDTIVVRLQDALNRQHPEVNWEVLNYGVSGASTAQEIVLYRKVVAHYDPELVVCAYFEGNDFYDNSGRLSSAARIYMDTGEDGRLYQKPMVPSRIKRSIWLNQYSRFYVWQKLTFRQARANIRAKIALLDAGPAQTYSTKQSAELEHAWILTEKLIQRFREEVRADGGRFLFLFIPAGETLYEDLWEKKYSAPRYELESFDRTKAVRRVGAMVESAGIDAVFLNQRYEETIAGRPGANPENWLYYGGDGHVNQTGQRLAAEAVYEHLLATGAIDAMVADCRATGPAS